MQRRETYTIANILAIVGGLLGLFLGISLLSVIEFIYFITLRLFWRVWRSKNENAVIQRPTLSRMTLETIEAQIPHYG